MWRAIGRKTGEEWLFHHDQTFLRNLKNCYKTIKENGEGTWIKFDANC
jgi:hypothetical protein